MLPLILTLLIIWAALAVAGVLIKGALWLLALGIVLFVITGVFGAITHTNRTR